jgi:hypothetical protein
MLDLLEEHGDLLVVAESGKPGAYLRSAPRAVYHVHLTALIRKAAPDVDPILTADTLLATLDPELFLHHRRVRETSLDELKAHWAAMARRLLG